MEIDNSRVEDCALRNLLIKDEEINREAFTYTPRTDNDSAWKDILEKCFLEFIQYFYPELYPYIDWEKGYKSLDKELNALGLGGASNKRIVDKLFEIKSRDGKDQWVFIHIEIQSQRDQYFEQRMFEYYYRIYDRHRKPIVSLAILADRHYHWRPQQYKLDVWNNSILQFKFFPVKLLDYQHGHPMLSDKHIFNMILEVYFAGQRTRHQPQQRLKEKFRVTRYLYQAGLDREKIEVLYKVIDWMLTLPPNLNLQYHNEIYQLNEEKNMSYITTTERMGIEKGFKQGIEAGIQQGIEAGIQQGIEAGIQQGMQQGVQKGLQQGEYKIFYQLLKLKFQNIPSIYQKRLEEADADTLLQWSGRILAAKHLDDIFI